MPDETAPDGPARSAVLVPAPLVRGRRWAVVAPHHLATAAGLGVLAAGGSAVDAAIATNAVLAVVMPNGCGIGGDAFWLIWDEATGRQHALNGSGRSPAATDAEAVRGLGVTVIPPHGPLSITVPGAVRSWSDAHDRFGRLSRAEILGPAIELAWGGFPAWPGLISSIDFDQMRLIKRTFVKRDYRHIESDVVLTAPLRRPKSRHARRVTCIFSSSISPSRTA